MQQELTPNIIDFVNCKSRVKNQAESACAACGLDTV
jgi:hypothetical protein